jgi:ribosome-associated translation inhibitor RaiA
MSRSSARSIRVSDSTVDVDLIETSPEVKSYIYQQLVDFQPYVTSDTMVYVIARNPGELPDGADKEEFKLPDESYKHRIAIILQEGDTSIEAEAYHDDIFYAIRLAKDSLIQRLNQIEDEVVDPNLHLSSSSGPSGNNQVH